MPAVIDLSKNEADQSVGRRVGYDYEYDVI